MVHKNEEKNLVQLEISFEKLAILFESGAICAAEIRCLTAQSKQQVSDLCLSSCIKRIACNVHLFSELPETQKVHIKNRYKLSAKNG